MNTPYTGPYDSILLNEIHRLFPALLYNPENYRTYYDVSNYIQSQMRGRYDIFSNTRNQYLSNSIDPNVAAPQEQAQQQQEQQEQEQQAQEQERPQRSQRSRRPVGPLISPPSRRTVNPILSPPPRRRDAPPRVIETPPRRLSPPSTTNYTNPHQRMTYIESSVTPGSYEEQIMDLLEAIGMPFNTAATLRVPLSTFQEPVIVRPSQLEIVEQTHLESLVAPVDDVCSICQEQYQANTEVRVINHCSHKFHTRCIDRWFQRNVHCPVCRHDIRENQTTSRQ